MKRDSKGLLLTFVLLGIAATVQAAPRVPEPLPPADSVKLEYEYENFDDNTEDWKLATVDYSHKFQNFGSVILRVNQASRFGTDGAQYEIDMYPKIRKGLYAYLNFGVSRSDLFP